MNSFFEKFNIAQEKEDLAQVIANIDKGVAFRGTNLWVLIFAIFVASLGLNVNSTAVIIGAMLISPLMGPIIGMGLGMGINDLSLLKKALYNYGIAAAVALITSTLFFLLSPLNEAHSEILSRTSPTIYDVLIAFFGGIAGIIAISSKQKGNVIPGVAIATALMPPLCTAGYGLATLQFNFFFGAFYLFIINTVFIALSTYIIVRFLHFPLKNLDNEKEEKMAKRITLTIVILTLLPSLYFGYDMIRKNEFSKNANRFITYEAHFPNDYLLNKKIDPKKRIITLVFGGNEIPATEIERVKGNLDKYNLENTTLEIKQGFAYLKEQMNGEKTEVQQLSKALQEKDVLERSYQNKLDSITQKEVLSAQLFAELKAQYPSINTAVIQPAKRWGDTSKTKDTYLVLLKMKEPLPLADKNKMESWLKVRLKIDTIQLMVQ